MRESQLSAPVFYRRIADDHAGHDFLPLRQLQQLPQPAAEAGTSFKKAAVQDPKAQAFRHDLHIGAGEGRVYFVSAGHHNDQRGALEEKAVCNLNLAIPVSDLF